jgi:hypothetical protein
VAPWIRREKLALSVTDRCRYGSVMEVGCAFAPRRTDQYSSPFEIVNDANRLLPDARSKVGCRFDVHRATSGIPHSFTVESNHWNAEDLFVQSRPSWSARMR